MKITPALFGLLFIRDRKWKELGALVGLVACLTLSSIFLLSYINPGTNAWDHVARMLENQRLFTQNYGLTTEGIISSHSLFGLIKFVFLKGIEKTNDVIRAIAPFYSGLMFILSVAIGGLLLLRKAPRQDFYFLIIFMMLLFPHMSADYKLLNLFLPILFCFETTLRSNWTSILQAVCLGLLVIPKSYIHDSALPEISSNAILSPILLIVALSVTLMVKTEDKNI
jgi:hypothetical protein